MRLFGHMVTRNEADRYLESTLRDLVSYCDAVAVCDDLSEDDTMDVLVALRDQHPNLRVAQRQPDFPSFAEDESQFREHAWRFMSDALDPAAGDWVLSLDADEYLASDGDRREKLLQAAQRSKSGTWSFDVVEMFGWDGDRPQRRLDGFWGRITATRFCEWRPQLAFVPQREGGGSVPAYVSDRKSKIDDPVILHFGYARESDQRTKYERYAAMKGGHQERHIKSIVSPNKRLETWTGPMPPCEVPR